MEEREIWERVRRLASSKSVGTLITVGKDGFPRARPLEDHNVGTDLIFWFASHRKTTKFKDLANSTKAAVYYFDEEQGAYASIKVEAIVHHDEETKRAHWRKKWQQYWPGGPTDPEYIVIELRPISVDYRNGAAGEFIDGYTPLRASINSILRR